jgi:hypothetical protein
MMVESEDKIVIPLSKIKISLLIAGCSLFVIVGIMFTIDPQKFISILYRNSAVIRISGILSLLFFGIGLIFFVGKLFDKKPGMVIDEIGFLDNSSALAAGRILWSDIENISILKMKKQKLMILHVKNPQDYIDRQKSIFKRKLMEVNYRLYGTPLSITSNGLKISFDELLKILSEKLKEHQ